MKRRLFREDTTVFSRLPWFMNKIPARKIRLYVFYSGRRWVPDRQFIFIKRSLCALECAVVMHRTAPFMAPTISLEGHSGRSCLSACSCHKVTTCRVIRSSRSTKSSNQLCGPGNSSKNIGKRGQFSLHRAVLCGLLEIIEWYSWK